MKKNKKKRNHHHLYPKSRGGKTSNSNLLLFEKEKHINWHIIFGNMTLYEVIITLIRLAKMKHYEENEPAIKKFYQLIEKGDE